MRILPTKINTIYNTCKGKIVLEQRNKNTQPYSGRVNYNYGFSNSSAFNYCINTYTFTGTKVRYTSEEVEEQKAKIKLVLQEAVKQNYTLKIKDISQKTGIATHTASRRISEHEELGQLWKKVRHIDYSKYSEDEKAEFEATIKELLEQLNASGAKMSVQEMVDRIGVSKTIVLGIINKNEYYKRLYENIHKTRPQKATLEEIKMQERQIKEVLLQVMDTGIKKSEREYSEILGITEKIFRLRIKNNPELKALYERVKNPPRKRFENGIEGKKELIKVILKQYVSENKKISRNEISARAGISGSTFRKIVLRDKEINLLWQNTQKKPCTVYTQNDIERIDNYIQWFLEDKIRRKEKTTVKEIAQFLDITSGLAGKRVNKNPTLKYRWNKVKSQNMVYYDKGEKEIQTEQITELLKEANNNAERLTYEDIARLTKLSAWVIKSRIKDNRKTQKLWNENKKLQ